MKRNVHAKDIILEAIRRVEPVKITKRELIKVVGIRKKVFLKALSELIGGSQISRSGTGRKRDPFKYGVGYFSGSTDDDNSFTDSYPSRKKMFFSY